MKPILLLIPLAVVACIFAGCIGEPPVINHTPVTTTAVTATTPAVTSPTPAGPELVINASPGRYTPTMSSTVGIGLTPQYTGPMPVNYSWETNYGRFLGWDQRTGKITEFGPTAITSGQVYWSFPPEDQNSGKPSVIVRAEAVDTATGRSLVNATIYIGWEDNTTAIVIQAPCGVTNCHGTTVTCGENIAEVCTMEYRLGDKCRALAACRVVNGTCTVVEQPGYGTCVSCAENCNTTYGDDPLKAFECESKC